MDHVVCRKRGNRSRWDGVVYIVFFLAFPGAIRRAETVSVLLYRRKHSHTLSHTHSHIHTIADTHTYTHQTLLTHSLLSLIVAFVVVVFVRLLGQQRIRDLYTYFFSTPTYATHPSFVD